MAREHQGLQITLVVFVMFTVVFMVLSFVFYRWYGEALTQASTAEQNQRKKDQELTQANNDLAALKQLIGAAEKDKVDEIRNDFTAKVAQVHLQSIPGAQQSFRKAIEVVSANLNNKNALLAAEQNTTNDLKNKLAEREGIAAKQRDEIAKLQAQNQKDLDTRTDEFKTNRDALTTEREGLRQQLAGARQKADEEVALARADKDAADAARKKIENYLAQAKGKIEQMEKPTFEAATGKIVWINQREKTAWINLGEADYLNRLTTFGVYDANTGDVTRAEKKASIEVIQIVGPHLAVARITDEKITNPILPDDVVHTPIWEPGRQKHFALAGFVDIDGDGKSDLEQMIRLIQMNGGVVDAYQTPDGKLNGTMTGDTNYFVVGKVPEESASKDYLKTFQDLNKNARSWALKRITIQDLLSQMGYKADSSVTRYGRTGNPSQLGLQATEGAQKTSNGPISPMFKERKPPVVPGAAAQGKEKSAY